MEQLYLGEATKNSAQREGRTNGKGQRGGTRGRPQRSGSCPQGPALALLWAAGPPGEDPRPGSGSPGPGPQAVTHPIRASAFLLGNGILTMPQGCQAWRGCVAAEHRAGGREPVRTGGSEAQIVHTRASRSGVRTAARPAWEAAPWRGRLRALQALWAGREPSPRAQQAPGAPAAGSSADLRGALQSLQTLRLESPGASLSGLSLPSLAGGTGTRACALSADTPEPIAESCTFPAAPPPPRRHLLPFLKGQRGGGGMPGNKVGVVRIFGG